MGEPQIRIGPKRKPEGPSQRGQDGPPPKNWGENVDEEETRLRPYPSLNRLANDSQSLDPRDNDPHIGDKVQASAKHLADKVNGSGRLDANCISCFAADLRVVKEILEAKDDERK